MPEPVVSQAQLSMDVTCLAIPDVMEYTVSQSLYVRAPAVDWRQQHN